LSGAKFIDWCGFQEKQAYFRSRFFIQKKLQISLPEIKKGLYVCSRLEKSLKGFGDKKKFIDWQLF